MSEARRRQTLEYFTGKPAVPDALKYYSGNDTTHVPEDSPLFDPGTMGNHGRIRRGHRSRPSHAPSARWV